MNPIGLSQNLVTALPNLSRTRYENIFKVISSHHEQNPSPSPSPDTMKNDLKSFLKKQLNLSTSTDISSLDYSFV